MGLRARKKGLDLMDRLVNLVIQTLCHKLNSGNEEESDTDYDSKFDTSPIISICTQCIPKLEDKLSRQLAIGVSDPRSIENVDAIKEVFSLDWDILVCLSNAD